MKKEHIFDGPHSVSLIYLGQIFENDWISILDKNEVNIIKDSKLILKVNQNKPDGLWDTPISKPLIHRAHAIITRDEINI